LSVLEVAGYGGAEQVVQALCCDCHRDVACDAHAAVGQLGVLTELGGATAAECPVIGGYQGVCAGHDLRPSELRGCGPPALASGN
jgi:hypothetical protein